MNLLKHILKIVVPDALDVTVGSCAGTLDSSTNQWTINTALDACSTTLSTNANGKVFTNFQKNNFRKILEKCYVFKIHP